MKAKNLIHDFEGRIVEIKNDSLFTSVILKDSTANLNGFVKVLIIGFSDVKSKLILIGKLFVSFCNRFTNNSMKA